MLFSPRFFFEEINNFSFMVLDFIMDLLYLTDVVLNFFFAYTKKTRVIKNFKLIAAQYVR